MYTKKLFMFSVLLFTTLFVVITFQSCNSEINDYEDFLNKEDLTNNKKTDWEDLLSTLLLTSDDKVLHKNELYLKSYEYKGSINSLAEIEQIKAEILSDKSMIPIYENSLDSFQVNTIGEVRKKSLLTNCVQDIQTYLDSIVVEGTKIIHLNWKYKNKTFKTIGVISEKENTLIYDNMLFNILLPIQTNNIPNLCVPRIQTKSETPQGTTISYTFNKEMVRKNYLGMETINVSVYCIVYGYVKNGQKYISTYNMEASKKSAFGFSAVADIKSITFQEGSNGHLRLAYGYGGGAGTITLSFSGTGFTASGGGEVYTGEKYIIPSYLK